MTDDSCVSLSLVQIAQLLQTMPQGLQAQLTPLPQDVWQWRPAEDEWCINEVLGHFIETEQRGFAGRIRQILAEDRPALEPWDIPGTAAARGDCRRDGRVLLAELAAMRVESASLVESLHPGQLGRLGLHPLAGELRVVDILHEWIHHDARHVKQILSNVQAFVWPYLGNAQRFSQALGMDSA